MARALAAMQAEVLAPRGHRMRAVAAASACRASSSPTCGSWWPALGATVAVALCVGLASGVWQATSAEQPASLAAMIENLADPGSNRNPLRLDAAM